MRFKKKEKKKRERNKIKLRFRPPVETDFRLSESVIKSMLIVYLKRIIRVFHKTIHVLIYMYSYVKIYPSKFIKDDTHCVSSIEFPSFLISYLRLIPCVNYLREIRKIIISGKKKNKRQINVKNVWSLRNTAALFIPSERSKKKDMKISNKFSQLKKKLFFFKFVLNFYQFLFYS